MVNVFDGWEKQIFNTWDDNQGGFCAEGWIQHMVPCNCDKERMCKLVDILMKVQKAVQAKGSISITSANDIERWTIEQFKALGVIIEVEDENYC